MQKQKKQEQTPFMDMYPQLSLLPTTIVSSPIDLSSYDYVQDLTRDNGKDHYHLIVKNRKFGVFYTRKGMLRTKASVIVKCRYDYITIITQNDKSATFKLQLDGKFGLLAWKLGSIFDSRTYIKPIYDDITQEVIGNFMRFTAQTTNSVVYYDSTCNLLR